ncbi:MAG: sulfite exporter TauE/SafE family protein, partial [Thermoanaerobaculia bacterium]
GTLLTFPALIFAGHSAITANATSTVALWPGALASMYGYRREIAGHREWLRTLFVPSVAGGILGAVLLLQTPSAIFERLAPFLILFATILFLLQETLWKSPSQPPRRGDRRRLVLSWVLQFAISVYGGYFGAGIGILVLAVLGFLGIRDIHAANGLKNFFGMCINGLAAAYFIARGAVAWPAALLMIAGAVAGGYAGARFARRIGQRKARAAVVVIGFLMAGMLLWLQASR